MRGNMTLDGVGGGKSRVMMDLRGLALMSLLRGNREVVLVTVVVVTVVVVTVMVVGGIDSLAGTGVVSVVVEAGRESVDGGELL